MTDPKSPLHILVVDDESSLLEELNEFLTLHGMVVSSVGDGVQALATLAADPAITVVLTDIRMPGLDGLGLANRVLQARGEVDAIEVVLMTGHGNIEDAAQAVRAGVFDFLRKPMELDEMLPVLERAHAKALARREAHALRLAEMERLRADYAALQARFARMKTPLALTGEMPPELAHILSHELRTPLSPIIALPDMLSAQETLPPGALNAYLRDVHLAGLQLLHISEDLIEFLAPPDARAFTWGLALPERLLARLVARLLPAAQAVGVKLVIVESTAGGVQTDELHLIGAFARLVTNALAATQPGGQVDLAARAVAPDSVAFTVRDSGRGMTAEELDLAKLPFRQIDMSITRRGGGMGLGLTLAIRMAERLGGRLEIESVPGVGTAAGVVLPRQHTDGRAR
jgi:signal transduction histidine kinase